MRSREELKRRKMKKIRLQSISVRKIRCNSRLSKRHRDRERRRSERSRDLGSFRRRLLIDKLRLMH